MNKEYYIINIQETPHLLVVVNEDLDDNVAELDVHDGGNGFLLWPHQGRPKAHAQVGHVHQVYRRVVRNPVMDHRQLVHYRQEENLELYTGRLSSTTGYFCDPKMYRTEPNVFLLNCIYYFIES